MSELDIAHTDVQTLVKRMLAETATVVQDMKLYAGDQSIDYLQNKDLMPDKSEIVSFHTSTSRNNAYPDYFKFRRVMRASPKLFSKRFIYVGTHPSKSHNEAVAAASRMAWQLVRERTAMYPKSTAPDSKHTPTLNLYNSIRSFVNGSMVTNTRSSIRDAIMESEGDAIYEISNIAPYASTSEARSYYHRVGGIIWYAANRVQRKFPQLGVFYGFAPAGGALKNASYGHKYNLPVLRIGTKEQASGPWSKPGQNHRKRLRQVRRVERIFKDGP